MKILLAIVALSGLLVCQNGAPKPSKPSPAGKQPAESGKQDPKKPGEQKPGKGSQDPKVERPEEDAPMPKGTDPADIAAMRSAEQMLEVEKRLQKEIKAGKITGLDKILRSTS